VLIREVLFVSSGAVAVLEMVTVVDGPSRECDVLMTDT